MPQEVKKTQEQTKAPVTMDDVMKRIEQLQKEVVKPRQEARPPQQAKPAPRPAPEPKRDLDKKRHVPDPVMDPEGYTKALTDQVLDAMRQQFDEREQRQQEKEAVKAKSERLWKRFSTTHPKHAKNKKLVEFMAGQVIEDMALDGTDIDAYINEQTDDFFGKIVSQIDDTLGKREDEEDEEREAKAGDDDDDGDEINYGALFGGDTPKSSKGKKGKAEDEEPDGGIVAQLRESQRKAGYY